MLKSGDVQDLFSHKRIIYSLKLSISFVFKSFFFFILQCSLLTFFFLTNGSFSLLLEPDTIF